MRTAVERLWAARGRSDWAAMGAQFTADARIRDAATGDAVNAEEYVARARVAGPAEVKLERVVSESNDTAVVVAVARNGATRRCGGFYRLRDGRVAGALEFWG